MAATFATALFAWWPAAASLSLLLTALAQTTTSQDGSQFLYLASVTGLVVYTSPLWFIVIYVVAASGLTILLATASSGILTQMAIPALALVLAVSLAIGWALRAAHGKERRLALDIAELECARVAAIDAERARISDELHDIIAHDVTLVSMRARVLERVDDQALRDQSVRAIRNSADQALADIRRVLRIVRDERPAVLMLDDQDHPNVQSALEEARTSLADLGADITVRATPKLRVSHSIEQALVHVLREGVTNIAKHGPDHATVRISLEATGDEVRLELRNSCTVSPRVSPVPSSGYGLDRLRERVTLLGGELRTQRTEATWAITARLPLR